jgi:hypothetical protein
MVLGYKCKRNIVYFSASGTYRPLTKLSVIGWGFLMEVICPKRPLVHRQSYNLFLKGEFIYLLVTQGTKKFAILCCS